PYRPTPQLLTEGDVTVTVPPDAPDPVAWTSIASTVIVSPVTETVPAADPVLCIEPSIWMPRLPLLLSVPVRLIASPDPPASKRTCPDAASMVAAITVMSEAAPGLPC